jgi:hypothetical protein
MPISLGKEQSSSAQLYSSTINPLYACFFTESAVSSGPKPITKKTLTKRKTVTSLILTSVAEQGILPHRHRVITTEQFSATQAVEISYSFVCRPKN